jgi:hypothetical protein
VAAPVRFIGRGRYSDIAMADTDRSKLGSISNAGKLDSVSNAASGTLMRAGTRTWR